MKKDLKNFKYESRDAEWLVPVYLNKIDPDRPMDYGEPEVIGLASISNPLEPLEHIFFVSHS